MQPETDKNYLFIWFKYQFIFHVLQCKNILMIRKDIFGGADIVIFHL